jgi:hypothetical protein
MNVFAYVAIVTCVGLVAAYISGRLMWSLSGLIASILFVPISFCLGAFLAFPLLSGVGNLCTEWGIGASECIRTDDRTVWFLGVPFLAFPAYLFAMFVARSNGKSRFGPSPKETNA